MSWLYKTSRKHKDYGTVTKEEGKVELVMRDDGYYRLGPSKDYYFVNSEGERTYLSTKGKPKSGMLRDRCVFLETEDDEKALSLIKKNIENDIADLELRIRNGKNLISKLRIKETEDETD